MIAVTGASGKTGRALSWLLTTGGVPHVRLSSRGAGDRHFDWADRETWASAFAGVNALYLVKPPHDTGMTAAVADLLAASPQIEQVVLLSEMARDEKSDDDPDRAVELAVEAWGGLWTILRPSWFFQNFSAEGGFHADLLAGRISIPTGDAPVSWLDTRDIAEAAMVVLTEPGHERRAYTLTGGESFSVADLARRFGAHLDLSIDTPEVIGQDRIDEARRSDSERQNYLIDLFVDVIEGRYAAITPELVDLIGRPPTTFDEFVRDHRADWS